MANNNFNVFNVNIDMSKCLFIYKIAILGVTDNKPFRCRISVFNLPSIMKAKEYPYDYSKGMKEFVRFVINDYYLAIANRHKNTHPPLNIIKSIYNKNNEFEYYIAL